MAKQYYKLVINGKTEIVWLAKQTYLHPRTLCVQMYDSDDMPFATITKNLCSKRQSFSRAFIDTSNCPWAEQFLVGYDLAHPAENIHATSGYCSYPLYEFDLDALTKSPVPERGEIDWTSI